MKPFELSIAGFLLRFYLMMAVILIGGFTGQWWMVGIGLPVFLFTILGVRLGKEERGSAKVRTLQNQTKEAKKVG